MIDYWRCPRCNFLCEEAAKRCICCRYVRQELLARAEDVDPFSGELVGRGAYAYVQPQIHQVPQNQFGLRRKPSKPNKHKGDRPASKGKPPLNCGPLQSSSTGKEQVRGDTGGSSNDCPQPRTDSDDGKLVLQGAGPSKSGPG